MAQPVTTETRSEIIRLHGAGCGRNEIARLVHVSTAVVTKIAKQEGLSFDRASTELAVRARTIDLADMRTLLAQKMAVAASDMLDQLDGPYLVYNFGGKDNDYNERTLDSAPVEVRRNIIATAGITFDKLTRIVEKDTGSGEAAAGVLDSFASALTAAADSIRAEGETSDAE